MIGLNDNKSVQNTRKVIFIKIILDFVIGLQLFLKFQEVGLYFLWSYDSIVMHHDRLNVVFFVFNFFVWSLGQSN